MKITKLEKFKNTYGLYNDELFLFAITEDTLVHFGIQKDKDYSEQELEKIHAFDQKILCVSQALRYLSRRPHLRAELWRKLQQKNYPNDLINQALDHLQKKGYLNDEEFIRRFISDEINLKHSGPLLIRSKLREKGAKNEQAESIINEIYGEDKVLENAGIMAERKIGRQKFTRQVKQKTANYLIRKGFTWEVVSQILNNYTLDDD